MLSFVDGCFYDCVDMVIDDHRDKKWVYTDIKEDNEVKLINELTNVETSTHFWQWLQEPEDDRVKHYFKPRRVRRVEEAAEWVIEKKRLEEKAKKKA